MKTIISKLTAQLIADHTNVTVTYRGADYIVTNKHKGRATYTLTDPQGLTMQLNSIGELKEWMQLDRFVNSIQS